MAAETKRRLPWGIFIVAGGLILVEVLLFRGNVGDREIVPWATVGSSCVATVAVFLLARQLHNGLWGLLAASLLMLHPSFQEGIEKSGPDTWAQAAAAAALTGSMLAAQLCYRTQFIAIAWLSLAAGLWLAVGLSWFWQPHLGLLAATLIGGGLLPMSLLGLAFRRRQPAAKPAWSNLLSAAAVGLLATVGGLGLGSVAKGVASENVLPRLVTEIRGLIEIPGNSSKIGQLEPWCWPNVWSVGLVALWAGWRTLKRGWKQWRTGQPPLAWHFALASLWIIAWSIFLPVQSFALASLPLTTLIVLWAVFWIADLLQGLMERLVLRPPDAG